MPDILDLLSFAEVGDIDSSKAFLEWSERNYEAIGATLARKDAVVGRTALHRAAENGHADYVKWLLGKGVDHLQPDNSGVTALHLAAIKGHVEVCKILLSHDTNGALAVQKPNDKGETAVHWAALSGNVDALMLLLQTCGAAARSLTDSRGNTPLHCAAMNNREAAVASLLSANADPAARNSAGDTPLHTAARSGALAAIYAFLPHLPVARRAVCNAEGQTPMDVASSEAVRSLLETAKPEAIASKLKYVNGSEASAARQARLLADEKMGIKRRSFAGSGGNVQDDF